MEPHIKLPYAALLKKFAKGEATVPFGTSLLSCVIYNRVSSKEQFENNNSLEWQKTICEKYAADNNLIVKNYFGGTFESAKSDERKEFNRMLKFIKQSTKDKIHYILVHSLDRFSRTGGNAIYIKDELNKAGVYILSATQPMDSKTLSGAFQQNIHFIFSRYENDTRKQKSVDGMRAKLLRGEALGSCPIGYSYVKGKPEQTIIIDEKGKYILVAFEMRADGRTYDEIITYLRINNIHSSKQNLSRIFRNVFYCGFISHTFLNGEVVKGKHPALVSQDLFLLVNQLCKTDNFKQKKVNDELPLKGFVRDFESGGNFTGYLASKGHYYYKVNKVGVNVNRSQRMMHEKFTEELNKLSINELFLGPLEKQLEITWAQLTEDRRGEKITYSLKLKDTEEKLNKLESRHAFGEISREIFTKFSVSLKEEKETISKEIEKHDFELSNPSELIKYSLQIVLNAASIWQSGDFYHKQRFQKLLFPQGIWFDAKNNHYRTEKINPVIGIMTGFTNDYLNSKMGTFDLYNQKSPLVPLLGKNPNLGSI